MMNSDHQTRNRLPLDAADSTAVDRGRQIDRLVSGDLQEAERVELLAWLDSEPTRWRRCGRAFLEAQVWREALAELEFGGTASTATVANPSQVVPLKPTITTPRWRSWRPVIGVFVVLCIFGCGWLSGQLHNLRSDGGMNSMAGNGTPGGTEKVNSKDQPGKSRSVNALAKRVVLEERPLDCEFTLPMLGAGLPAEHWARQASVPAYVKSRWGSQGYQVSEKRQFVPMELADGRQVVVPINHVTLTYVGQQLL